MSLRNRQEVGRQCGPSLVTSSRAELITSAPLLQRWYFSSRNGPSDTSEDISYTFCPFLLKNTCPADPTT